jgi:hypothetical protein
LTTATGSAPLLLQAPPHNEHASPHSRDFQSRVGRPSTHSTDPEPCVVVFTRAVDREIDYLSLRLASKGIALVRVDSDRCAATDIAWLPTEGVLSWEGRRYRPLLSWLRYFDTAALTPTGTETETLYAREQWGALALAMNAAAPRAVNAAARPGQPDRVTQLAAARAAGLRVPRTVVTANLAAALDLLPDTADVLVKSLGRHAVEPQPGRLRAILPTRVSRAELPARTEVAPVLVQEFVPAARELRIYAVGGTFFGFAVSRPTPQSLWTNPGDIAAEPWAVPEHLAAALHRLTERFELDVAAFDLLDTPEGPVFLEVNPEFDWLWTEHLAGSAETSAAILTLITTLFTAQKDS